MQIVLNHHNLKEIQAIVVAILLSFSDPHKFQVISSATFSMVIIQSFVLDCILIVQLFGMSLLPLIHNPFQSYIVNISFISLNKIAEIEILLMWNVYLTFYLLICCFLFDNWIRYSKIPRIIYAYRFQIHFEFW